MLITRVVYYIMNKSLVFCDMMSFTWNMDIEGGKTFLKHPKLKKQTSHALADRIKLQNSPESWSLVYHVVHGLFGFIRPFEPPWPVMRGTQHTHLPR